MGGWEPYGPNGMSQDWVKKRLVDLEHPDQRRSDSRLKIRDTEKDLAMAPSRFPLASLISRTTLVVRVRGNPDTGRINGEGVSLFTEDEIHPLLSEKDLCPKTSPA